MAIILVRKKKKKKKKHTHKKQQQYNQNFVFKKRACLTMLCTTSHIKMFASHKHTLSRRLWEPQRQKTYFQPRAASEDSDQPAHSHSLIRIFTLDSPVCKVCSCGQRRLWSNYANRQAVLCCRGTHMSDGKFIALQLLKRREWRRQRICDCAVCICSGTLFHSTQPSCYYKYSCNMKKVPLFDM